MAAKTARFEVAKTFLTLTGRNLHPQEVEAFERLLSVAREMTSAEFMDKE